MIDEKKLTELRDTVLAAARQTRLDHISGEPDCDCKLCQAITIYDAYQAVDKHGSIKLR
jgi:hypothetical protein